MITKNLEMRIAEAQGTLDKFTADFAKNPAYAFQWSDAAFRAAARLEITKRVLVWLQEGADLPQVIQELNRQVRFNCRNPSHSTSTTHNLIEQCKLAELADVVEDLERWAK